MRGEGSDGCAFAELRDGGMSVAQPDFSLAPPPLPRAIAKRTSTEIPIKSFSFTSPFRAVDRATSFALPRREEFH